MALPSTTPSDGSNTMLQPTAVNSALPAMPQSPESPPVQAPMTTRDTPRTLLEDDHNTAVAPGPLPDRPMIPTSAADWETRKGVIRELYLDQNMILNEVIEIMVTKYKFKATARMYKGQFAKWKWTKYNKTGNNGSRNPTKSKALRKRGVSTREGAAPSQAATPRKPPPTHTRQPASLSRRLRLQYLGDEECQVESTLNAYAVLISHWSERETPWKASSWPPDGTGQLFRPQEHSILQYVRAAQDHFQKGRPQLGGELLRRAFLGIESAVECGLDVEALWDCCLAVPHLVLTMGWTDILSIFARYLHQLTSIKLPGHPLTKIAASLHKLSSSSSTCSSPSSSSSSAATRLGRGKSPCQQWQLEMFVLCAWRLWIDCVSRVRGRYDGVTIHLKRGYVTLVDPHHPMAADIIRDFGRSVDESLAKHGTFATTSRILMLEHLLARMFVPLFTPQTARRAEEILAGIATRVEGKPGNKGVPMAEWGYLDRYLVFSANHFRSSIAEHNGEPEKAAWYRGKCLDSPKDLFWLQTSLLVESTLRTDGEHEEANTIQEARIEVQSRLGLAQKELRLTGENARDMDATAKQGE